MRYRMNLGGALILGLAGLGVSFQAFGQASPAQALPEGPGKATVETACVGCHELRRVTNSGYTPEGWKTVVAMMVNVGAPIPQDQIGKVTSYLAAHFPEKKKPPATAIAGPVQVSFREWTVPTPGSRPHDPLATADGAIWYSGQMANALGRLDPKTGQFKEYHPNVPMSGPHGLVADSAGNIWFTANFKSYIGRLDPGTGIVTEFDVDARDPHTLLFDRNGMLWFTAQGANKVGRLDPKTGQAKIVTVPTMRALPYGMVIDSHGAIFFDEFGTNKIGRLDPETMAIREFELPNKDARPRRIAITADDIIWYSDYARGHLGRLDPKTGAVKEWPSPGGRDSRPYGITALNGVIWYSESNVKPNTLVRFDPATEKFQTWIIPSGGGVVRNMMPTADGNLVLAESGENKVALVEVK